MTKKTPEQYVAHYTHVAYQRHKEYLGAAETMKKFYFEIYLNALNDMFNKCEIDLAKQSKAKP